MTNTTTSHTESTKEQVTNKAGEVASTAKDQAAGVAHDAKHQARHIAEESRDQLRQQADQQARRLAQTMRDTGRQLQNMASGKAAPSGMLADVTEQAASSAHHMADTLDQQGLDGVISGIKGFARRKPGVFIAGALGVGLVAGRLLRSMDTGAVVQAAKPDNEPGIGRRIDAGDGQPPPVTRVAPAPGSVGPQPVIPPPEL